MVCADGSYGKLNNVDSCGGRFIALVGGNGKMCPITWGSRKFPRPERSALAAEAQAAADASSDKRGVIHHTDNCHRQLTQTVDRKKTLVPQLLKYRHTYFYISIELMVIVLPVNRCADV